MEPASNKITSYLWALLALALGLGACHALAIHSHCWEGLHPHCFIRWDSGLYLDIAKHGHTLLPCDEDPNKWCGNAGWAPLYPYMVRALHFLTPLSWEWSAVWVAWAGMAASLWLLARMAQGLSWQDQGFLFAAVLVAPGSIYFYAAFPLSWTLFLSLGLLHGLWQGKRYWAWISAILLVWIYSIGFVFLFLLAGLSVYTWSIDEPRPLRKLSQQALGLGILSMLALFVFEWISTGQWNATFLVQAKYGHTLNQPLKFMGIHAQRLLDSWGGITRFIEIQHFGIWAFWLLFAITCRPKQRTWASTMSYFAIFALFVLWALPYGASPDVALYRNAALGAPFWIWLVIQQPKAQRWLWLLFFGICWGPMAVLFFQSILI